MTAVGHDARTPDATRNRSVLRRVSTETKSAFKTTEFIAFVAMSVLVLIASLLVKVSDGDNGHSDYFRADKAWFYIVILTVGYMISRGLAKSGSRDFYDDEQNRRP